MFGNKNNGSAAKSTSQNAGTNIIVGGTTIKGDIESKSDTRIDGHLEGNLNCQARLLLGEKGKVVGNIRSKEAIIEGTIHGDVQISSILTLKSTAIITGDLTTNKLIVESGATINGQCSMGDEKYRKVKDGSQEGKSTEKKEKSTG
jgi:cytoskeletal protein CcmA (bactofilin family)